MSVMLLTEHHLEFLGLTGGCIGSSESILVKMPHCWKSNVTTQVTVRWSHSAAAFTQLDKWASSRENLSSGFPSKRDSNQSPQLQRQSRKLNFHQ